MTWCVSPINTITHQQSLHAVDIDSVLSRLSDVVVEYRPLSRGWSSRTHNDVLGIGLEGASLGLEVSGLALDHDLGVWPWLYRDIPFPPLPLKRGWGTGVLPGKFWNATLPQVSFGAFSEQVIWFLVKGFGARKYWIFMWLTPWGNHGVGKAPWR